MRVVFRLTDALSYLSPHVSLYRYLSSLVLTTRRRDQMEQQSKTKKRERDSPSSSSSSSSSSPLVVFGLVSDVQYADIEDRPAFHGQIRYYRNALVCLKQALAKWNDHNSSSPSTKLSFLLNLGDIVDGRNEDNAETAVDDVLTVFDEYKDGPIYHLLGNHCLYHMSRDLLHPKLSKTRLNLHPQPQTTTDDVIITNAHHYYSFSPHPNVRFICLDAYDVSLLGWPKDHPHYIMATKILADNNPNKEKNSYSGLSGDKKRFVAFNGGIGEEQMKWLASELDKAKEQNQKVFICSHVPLVATSAFSPTFLWNYKEVLALIDQYPKNVVCTLAGHEHEGGYLLRNKVHHYIVPAIVECLPGQNAFAVVEIFDQLHFDGMIDMIVNGFGIIDTKQFNFI